MEINPKDGRPMGGRYRCDLGRNVEMILAEGVRAIRGTIPREVRKELMAAVKLDALGHMKKDGLKPEVFFHPDHKNWANAKRDLDAAYSARCIAGVLVPFRDLSEDDQRSRLIELTD